MAAPPLLLVVDGRAEVASARARTLQDEAGDALEVRAASTVGEVLDAMRQETPRLAAVATEHDLFPGLTGLDLLGRLRREAPHVRRILVTARDLAPIAAEPEYARLHAAFETRGRFADVASGVVQDALETARARPVGSRGGWLAA